MYENRKISEGTLALYKGDVVPYEIKLCNITEDKTGVYFNAIDTRTGDFIKNRLTNVVLRWNLEYAIKANQVELLEDTIEGVEYSDSLMEKIRNLGKFYMDNVLYCNEPFRLDNEQLLSILSNNNTLVTARAGSGKTRVLIAKLIYLFEKGKLKDNNVWAFCFNKDAKLEILSRLQNNCKINNVSKYKSYNIAHTFHSFSVNNIQKKGKILEDRQKLLKLIINELKNSDAMFAKSVYNFFRKETLRIDRKNFHDIESYYKYLRNCEYTTLNNEKVKSRAEKYIADFLFEYGIDYIYEKGFYPSKISFINSTMSDEQKKEWVRFIGKRKEILPDFYLPKLNAVWEHWAATGKEGSVQKMYFEKTVGSYDEYLKNKQWKQKFWEQEWRESLADENKYNTAIKSVKMFIETDFQMFNQRFLNEDERREFVEGKLYQMFTGLGVQLQKLPEDVLIEKVWEKSIDGFTLLIDQFINKYQQNYFDNVDKFIEDAKNIEDDKTKTYYRLGYKVYQRYIEILKNKNNQGDFAEFNNLDYDFNQIIYECAKRIREGDLDDEIKQIKWILIDEYQDFSRLFDFLIESILQRNDSIKLFCVGDDWQAINRYAGSDFKYFNNFITRYKNAETFNIRTNYRCDSNIVLFANKFMNECGFSGKAQRSILKTGGDVKQKDISKIFIEDTKEDSIYFKYLNEKEYKLYEKVKYLKICTRIIKNNKNKRIFILSRGNQILGKEIEEFQRALKRICQTFMTEEEYVNNVFVKTVHTAKGEEADIVILLNVNQGVFPVYNPNNDLFQIFGYSSIDTVEDEERLYYVAITRAKHELYVLYEQSKKSSFILD